MTSYGPIGAFKPFFKEMLKSNFSNGLLLQNQFIRSFDIMQKPCHSPLVRVEHGTFGPK